VARGKYRGKKKRFLHFHQTKKIGEKTGDRSIWAKSKEKGQQEKTGTLKNGGKEKEEI